jgi:SAM-dependent methyltransferase
MNDVYAAALAGAADPVAREAGGARVPFAVRDWLEPAQAADERLLRRAAGPVLDVGCGPGRHVRALAVRGVPALGLDVSVAAVDHARALGTRVHHGSVFDVVPDAGAWRTALLLDGNLGIGADPAALLARVGELLAPGGRVLCETEAPGTGLRIGPVRLEDGHLVSPWFAWARVGADALAAVAAAAGLEVVARWTDAGRWFAELAA